jgi:GNAT superfamily N-acetyltransferase
MNLVLQHLSLRDQDAISNLLRGSGQPGRPERHVIAPTTNNLDSDSPALPAERWMAGVFFAEELTSFVWACDGSLDGQLEAELFVDPKWRRQGIGTLLLEAAVDWALLCKARSLRFVCARTDWPMRRLAEKFGARLDLAFGQIIADIPLGGRISQRQSSQTATEILRK